ncbi:MAG: tyrosine-type recombinase/integrase [Candidatus Brocadiales bacterium]|nr:tyrosine-type recombinase/integrase [Candidatus Brocadiales bacterium]
MKAFDPLIIGYMDYCKNIKKLKHESIKDLKCSIGKLIKFLDDDNIYIPIWELELDVFIRYLSFLREKNERGTGIAKQLSHIRGFIDYCWKLGNTTRNPLDGFNVKDNEPQYVSRVLTIEEMTALINACSRKTKLERKERLIVLLLYGLGLRTGELCKACEKDINVEAQELFVKGKFDIERRIPIPDGVWIELLAYLQEHRTGRGTLIKTNHKKTKLGIADVGKIIKKYSKLAGLEGLVTPKTLRHTFASHLIDQGVDISIISSLMGHKSPGETGVYLHAFKNRKEDAISSMGTLLTEEE